MNIYFIPYTVSFLLRTERFRSWLCSHYKTSYATSGFNTNTLMEEVEYVCQLCQIPLSQTCGLSDVFF